MFFLHVMSSVTFTFLGGTRVGYSIPIVPHFCVFFSAVFLVFAHLNICWINKKKT